MAENVLFTASLRLNLCLLTYVMSQTSLVPSPRLKLYCWVLSSCERRLDRTKYEILTQI